MQGKRAPELAAGKIDDVLASLFEASAADLMLVLQHSQAMAAQMAIDFNHARAHMASILSRKLAIWQQLPWRLCSLAVPDEDEGRKHASL
eukprot:1907749-Amphidinium_carterae.1